jgi:signal transduction histidine kinase
MSELLAAYDMPEERRKELNLAINDEVKRLTRMITQYLDITRLEAGATVLRSASTRIEPLIDRVLLMAGPSAAAKHITLLRDLAPGLPGLIADADLLFRAIENLVSNAVKYSPPETSVFVRAHASEDELVVEVEDRGYGITAADVDHIFNKFYRVPRVDDADVPGTGLGLSLVREIVELHGGSVHVQSELKKGSVFTLRLPLQRRDNVKFC